MIARPHVRIRTPSCTRTEAIRRMLGGAATAAGANTMEMGLRLDAGAADTGLPPEWAEPAIRRPVALFFVLFFFMCVAHLHAYLTRLQSVPHTSHPHTRHGSGYKGQRCQKWLCRRCWSALFAHRTARPTSDRTLYALAVELPPPSASHASAARLGWWPKRAPRAHPRSRDARPTARPVAGDVLCVRAVRSPRLSFQFRSDRPAPGGCARGAVFGVDGAA